MYVGNDLEYVGNGLNTWEKIKICEKFLRYVVSDLSMYERT